MNLADAIRAAAQGGGVPLVSEVPTAFQPKGESVAQGPEAYVSQSAPPEAPSPAVIGGNVVRIELFMSAEQTTNMLRAIMIGQHTILTLAEAAHYLRIRPQTLSRLAEEGEIQGVEIDGKWRFPKNHLDEWIYATVGQTVNEVEQQDVA